MDLSVIIPARNEMFLQQTIKNILENIEADTEIIAICDGYNPTLEEHPRVKKIVYAEPIGQRAGTNVGASISRAKFIMKIDAHCAVGKGFDRILMEDCQYDWTMIPTMWNLHAFDWECKQCKNRTYQGTLPTECSKCKHTEFEMIIVWAPRGNKVTYSWRFDGNMQFQYWKKHRKRPECQGDLIETMSCIGACFFIHRERFWDLEGMDEGHGSWGQFGTELACKAWLSGGKMITTKKTWFGHMFRTGNFAGAFESGTFPYDVNGEAQEYAKLYSRDLWLNDKWPKQKYKLEWLVEKFKPVPGWHDEV